MKKELINKKNLGKEAFEQIKLSTVKNKSNFKSKDIVNLSKVFYLIRLMKILFPNQNYA